MNPHGLSLTPIEFRTHDSQYSYPNWRKSTRLVGETTSPESEARHCYFIAVQSVRATSSTSKVNSIPLVSCSDQANRQRRQS